MRHENRMLNSPDHILSLFELELQPAVPGATEVGPAVAGLDGGVGEVTGVTTGLCQPPGQTRGHSMVRVAGGMVTIGSRLLFPLARQGLGDGAAPHQVVTGSVNILSEKIIKRLERKFLTFHLSFEEEDAWLVHGAVAGPARVGVVGDHLAHVADIDVLQQQQAEGGYGPWWQIWEVTF